MADIERLCKKYPNDVLRELLSLSFWPEGVEQGVPYRRYDDDTRKGRVVIRVSPNDGDVWLSASEIIASENMGRHAHLRFRTPYRGESENTHKALKILALAIKLDNEKMLQDRSE